jgi:predicted metal-dependent phosphoesterase TrpH
MAPRLADLHSHTYYSDGTDSPRRLIELAKKAGLAAIAVTDHDILEGHPEAEVAARELGVELIPGIEMSASVNNVEVHVLGYFLDPANAALRRHLAEQRDRRLQRMRDMVAKLRSLGVLISVDDVMAVAGRGTMGRPHVAEAMVKGGYVNTPREAFDRYIGNTGPGFIPGSQIAPRVVIDVILQAGGVPVLAHPIYLKDDGLIDQFAHEGLAGVEAYHSSHSAEQIKRYEQVAQRLGLLRTGGSDYHGGNKEGVAIGAATVPYELVDALRDWQRRWVAARKAGGR